MRGCYPRADRSVKDGWSLFREAGSQWLQDKAPRLGAALSYYTAFSLAPLLVIVIAVAGVVAMIPAAMLSRSQRRARRLAWS